MSFVGGTLEIPYVRRIRSVALGASAHHRNKVVCDTIHTYPYRQHMDRSEPPEIIDHQIFTSVTELFDRSSSYDDTLMLSLAVELCCSLVHALVFSHLGYCLRIFCEPELRAGDCRTPTYLAFIHTVHAWASKKKLNPNVDCNKDPLS